jgi:hypothetical protein
MVGKEGYPVLPRRAFLGGSWGSLRFLSTFFCRMAWEWGSLLRLEAGERFLETPLEDPEHSLTSGEADLD